MLFRIGRSLWRKAAALLTELGVAAERLSAVSAELEAITGGRAEPEPAVFADPTELRRQRYLASKQAARERHRGGRPRTGRA